MFCLYFLSPGCADGGSKMRQKEIKLVGVCEQCFIFFLVSLCFFLVNTFVYVGGGTSGTEPLSFLHHYSTYCVILLFFSLPFMGSSLFSSASHC